MSTESDQAWMRLGTARARLHYAIDRAERNGLRLPSHVAEALAEANESASTWNALVAEAEAQEIRG